MFLADTEITDILYVQTEGEHQEGHEQVLKLQYYWLNNGSDLLHFYLETRCTFVPFNEKTEDRSNFLH